MAQLVKPKNELKEKVGDGGFSKESLARAQRAIEDNDVDFVPIALKYLDIINQALASQDQDEAEDLYSVLLDQLTQLRAQGALFHYPSVTALTDIVVDLLDSLKKVDNTIIEIVQAYEKSAKIVLSSQVKEPQNVICQSLAKELQAVCNKYKDRQQA